MKVFLILLYYILVMSPTFAISQSFSHTLDSKKDTNKLSIELNSKQKHLQFLKKELAILALKNYYFKKEFSFLKDKEKYLTINEKYKILESLYKNLAKEIQKEKKQIKEQTKSNKKSEKENVRLQNKTKEEFSEGKITKFINPVSGEYIGEGKYSLKLNKGVAIRAPFTGTINKISYKEGYLVLVIENEKCTSYIEGLDQIYFSLGDQVRAKDIIGESSDGTLTFEITCKK